jgi:hypothetical protein
VTYILVMLKAAAPSGGSFWRAAGGVALFGAAFLATNPMPNIGLDGFGGVGTVAAVTAIASLTSIVAAWQATRQPDKE